jgi:hypothetical protein
VVIVALLLITRGSSSTTVVHKPNASAQAKRHAKLVPIRPSAVTVAVLNGTTVPNLAHDVSSRLATDGYRQGAIATAATQTFTTTVVAYLPSHERAARAVAAVLNLGSGAVQPVNQQAIGVACPGATASSHSQCSADVIVTIGTDLSSLATSSSG